MKRLTTFLMALLLITLGASADVDFSSRISNTTAAWQGATGTLQTGVENYSGSAFETGRILYQVIEGLPAGTYTVSFYAAANTPYLTGYSGTGIAQAFANDVTNAMTVGTSNGDNIGTLATDAYLQTLSNVTVGNDGTLTYGIQNVATGGQWYVAQGLSITLTSEIGTKQLEEGYVVEEEDGDANSLWHYSQTFTGSGENGALGYNTWSGEAGMTTPYQQVWVGAGDATSGYNYLSDQTIDHYQFMGLPAGYYVVTVDARVLSELDNELAEESAYFVVNNQTVDIVELASTKEDFAYGSGTESEASGSYDIIAEVTATDGTLDIGFSITSANYNWLSWKNLKVEYLGTTIPYTLGEPQCSATIVMPGEELTITFPDCITPNTDETPVLDSSKSITVNGSEVEATLTTTGLTATVTITIPESIGYGATVTVSVPAGLLTWAGSDPAVSSPAEDVTFTLSTPVIADQKGVYLMNVHTNMLLSRGLNSGNDNGTAPTVDVYGLPVDITVTDEGKYNIRYIDSNLYIGGTWWAAGDADQASAANFTLVIDDDGYYRFRNGSSVEAAAGDLYVNETTTDGHSWRLGLNDDSGAQESQRQWIIYSKEQRDEYKAANVLNAKLATAQALDSSFEGTTDYDFDTFIASLNVETLTSKVGGANLATTEDLDSWTAEYVTEDSETGTTGTGFTAANNVIETYDDVDDLTQTITGLEEGIYKVTLQGYNRMGDPAYILANLADYDISLATLGANEDEINLKTWASERPTDQGNTYPSSTSDAAACFTDGLYNNELYTYVSEGGSLTITIACPDFLWADWVVFTNMTLTRYYAEDIYTNDVTWKLANPSFEVDNVMADLSADGTHGSYSVTSLTGWDLVTPTNETAGRAVCDLMTAEATATDDNYGLPGAPNDGTYMLYLRNSWASSNVASVKQTVTLPAGEYKLTVDNKSASTNTSTDKKVTLLAGEATKELTIGTPQGTATTATGVQMLENWTTSELKFTVEEEGKVELGVEITFDGNPGLSVLLDNFKLYTAIDEDEYEKKFTETITWEMTDAMWGTLILPFAATLEDGLTAYSCDGTEEATDEDGKTITEVALTEVGQSIEANTPYVIKADETVETAVGTHEFKGVPTPAEDGTYYETYTVGYLTGTLVDLAVAKGAAFTLDGTEYLLQNHTTENDPAGYGVGFYPVTEDSAPSDDDLEGASLDAYHCYLTVPAESSDSANPVRAFIGFPDAGEETGIVAVGSDEVAVDVAIYDLSGRRVTKAVKGVYIMNGKKVLVK